MSVHNINISAANDLIVTIPPGITLDAAYERHLAFHKLWSAAVGTPDYDKSQWKEFEQRLARVVAVRFGSDWVYRAIEARKHAAEVALYLAKRKEPSVSSVEPQELSPEVRELMDKIFAMLRGRSVEVAINVLLNIVINIVKQTGGQFDQLKKFLADMIDVHAGATMAKNDKAKS